MLNPLNVGEHDLGPVPRQQSVDQLPDHLLTYHHWTAKQLKDWKDKFAGRT